VLHCPIPDVTAILYRDAILMASVRGSHAIGFVERVNDTAAKHFCKRSERMNLGTLLTYNVVDLDPAYSQRIRDERTMATLGNGFRTHHRAPLLPRQFYQSE
jgi:hypothetical protein